MSAYLLTSLMGSLGVAPAAVPNAGDHVHAANPEHEHEEEHHHQQELSRSDLSQHPHSVGRSGVAS